MTDLIVAILESASDQLQDARDRFMTTPRHAPGDVDTQAIGELFNVMNTVLGILGALSAARPVPEEKA